MAAAAAFREAFLDVYRTARSAHSKPEWESLWGNTNSWSRFMIQEKSSVIRSIAPRLNLICWPGEPLRLDAIFSRPGQNTWFPIQVAIEHENNPNNIYEEIRCLLSVRSPLKVCVTYSLPDFGNPANLPRGVLGYINSEFKAADIGENPGSEYLFLLGEETFPGARELRWLSLDFKADLSEDVLTNKAWQDCENL